MNTILFKPTAMIIVHADMNVSIAYECVIISIVYECVIVSIVYRS